MLHAAIRHSEPLPAEHPCAGCAVRSSSPCGVLDDCELKSFKGLSWTLSLAPGQPLFHEGDPANRVCTLTSGCLKLYKLMTDGRRQVTGFVFPGDLVGISIDEEHVFTAESLVQSEVCWFPVKRFDNFLEDHVKLERELYRIAAHELAAAQHQMVLLGRKMAAERMASFLIWLAEKDERRSGGQARFVDLPMSRSDIADYLGLTKETVSRVLAHLKRERLVRLETLNKIEILDREGLAAVAEAMDQL